jgi:hypothetical protein
VPGCLTDGSWGRRRLLSPQRGPVHRRLRAHAGAFRQRERTPHGWLHNYEHLMVFTSWEASRTWLQQIAARIERLWNGREEGWRAPPVPEAVRRRLIAYAPAQAPEQDPFEEPRPPVPPTRPADQKEWILFQFLRDAPPRPGRRYGRGWAAWPLPPTPAVPGPPVRGMECGIDGRLANGFERSTEVVAERGGFEPPCRFRRQDAFEAPPLRPLRYLSGRSDREAPLSYRACPRSHQALPAPHASRSNAAPPRPALPSSRRGKRRTRCPPAATCGGCGHHFRNDVDSGTTSTDPHSRGRRVTARPARRAPPAGAPGRTLGAARGTPRRERRPPPPGDD